MRAMVTAWGRTCTRVGNYNPQDTGKTCPKTPITPFAITLLVSPPTLTEHCASPAAVQAAQQPAVVVTLRRLFVAWPRIPVPDGSLFQLHESVSEADAAPHRRSTAREHSIMWQTCGRQP